MYPPLYILSPPCRHRPAVQSSRTNRAMPDSLLGLALLAAGLPWDARLPLLCGGILIAEGRATNNISCHFFYPRVSATWCSIDGRCMPPGKDFLYQ